MSSSRGTPDRDGLWRGLTWIAVVLLAVIGIVAGSAGSEMDSESTLGNSLIVASVICVMLAVHLVYRLRARPLESDDDATVLYLRRFEFDGQRVLVNTLRTWVKLFSRPIGFLRRLRLFYTARYTWEDVLRAAARDVGPVGAIGDPRDRIPIAGISTQQMADDRWQARVVEMAMTARLIVIRAGLSDPVRWEISQVVEQLRSRDRPRTLLLYVGQRSRKLTDWRPSRAAFYEEFREQMSDCFPHGLPERIGRARFIRFDDDWHGQPHRYERNANEPDPAFRVANYMESVL